jgi:hypothetical protein
LDPTRGHSPWLPGRLGFAAQIAEPSGGIIIPIELTIAHQDQGLSEAKARRDEINDTLHALGLEGDRRIRVDRSLSDGIRQAVLENNATLDLLGWREPPPLNAFLVESLTAEISRTIECAVVVAVISETPIDKIVLAISKTDLVPSRLGGLRAFLGLAQALSTHKPLIVGPVDQVLLADVGIFLPEKAEFRSNDSNIIPWIEQTVEKNSLIIATSRGWAFDRFAAVFI